MITRIERGKITVKQYGLLPGRYNIKDCTAEELLEERRILLTYRQCHPEISEIFSKENNRLDARLARIIDRKCQR